jgi:hypothetical protein
LGLLVSWLADAVTMLLLALYSGQKARKQVKDKGIELARPSYRTGGFNQLMEEYENERNKEKE